MQGSDSLLRLCLGEVAMLNCAVNVKQRAPQEEWRGRADYRGAGKGKGLAWPEHEALYSVLQILSIAIRHYSMLNDGRRCTERRLPSCKTLHHCELEKHLPLVRMVEQGLQGLAAGAL